MLTINKFEEETKYDAFKLPEICLMYKGRLYKDLSRLLTAVECVWPDEISLVRLMYVKDTDKYKFVPLVVEDSHHDTEPIQVEEG